MKNVMRKLRVKQIALCLLLICAFRMPGFAETDTVASVVQISIDGTIDIGLAKFVERVVEEANEQASVSAILVEINTFGGRLDAATQIKDALLSADAETIIFINRRAISAGALISLACDNIVMAPGSSIGAATVVDGAGEAQSEKSQSFMRSEMRATAEQNGRNARVAEAMVDHRIYIEDLVDSTQLLTLTADEALKWGIADTVLATLADVKQLYGLDNVEMNVQSITWSEEIVRFLTDPVVSSLLMTIGFLGLLFEVKTAGWGIGGTIGVIALGLFFGVNFIAELASFTEILIFALGVGLLIVEATVIPGFGLAGIAGIALIIWSLFEMLISEYPSHDDISRAMIGLSIAIVGAIVALVVIFRNLPKTTFWKRIALASSLTKESGVKSAVKDDIVVGMIGTALSDLRPAGKVAIGDSHIDVVTEGDYIKKNTQVKIIKIVGNRIVVRLTDNADAEADAIEHPDE